jgi:hypothetical protein
MTIGYLNLFLIDTSLVTFEALLADLLTILNSIELV